MAKNYVFTLGILLLLSFFCKAQVEPFTRYYNLDPEWVGNYFEQIIHTPDGGYAAVFNQNQGFTMRTSLLKLDQFGVIEWHTIIEDPEYIDAMGFSLCIDNDANFYLAGEVDVIYNEEYVQKDALIAKFTSDGDILWKKNYNLDADSLGRPEAFYDILFTDSGKLIAAGFQNYCGEELFAKSLIICLNDEGEIDWIIDDCDIDYTVEMNKSLISVISSGNGNFYAVGNTIIPTWFDNKTGYTNYQGIVFKFNESGDLIFRKLIGRPAYQAYFSDICMITENNFAVTGWISDTSGVLQSYADMQTLFIFDSTFNLKYQHNKYIGGGSAKQKIVMTKDSVLYVIAATDIFRIDAESDYKNDLLILKYSTKGELFWHKFIGGHDIDISDGHLCVIDDADNGATFGFNQYDYTSKSEFAAVLMKIDSLGNGIYNESNFQYPDSSEYIIYNRDKPINSIDNVYIYPNPASEDIIINITEKDTNCELKVYSITGKLVDVVRLSDLQNRIDISKHKNGIYIFRIKISEEIIYKKIIVNH